MAPACDRQVVGLFDINLWKTESGAPQGVVKFETDNDLCIGSLEINDDSGKLQFYPLKEDVSEELVVGYFEFSGFSRRKDKMWLNY